MTTTSITPTTGTASTNQVQSAQQSLNSQDFINMMIAQLQNQDPLNPTSNSDLLSQMSQIGQMQANTDLQTTLKGMAVQSQISAGGSLIGKTVTGLDANSNQISGVVQSVRVDSGSAYLELDNNQELPLNNVTAVAPGPTLATTTVTPTATTSSALIPASLLPTTTPTLNVTVK